MSPLTNAVFAGSTRSGWPATALTPAELTAAPKSVRAVAGRGRERVRHAVLEQGAERRDADGHTTEAERVVDARGHPRSGGIDDTQGAGGERGVRDADPDPSDDEAREQRGPSRVGTEPVHQQETCGDEREARADRHAKRYACSEVPRREWHEEHEDGERQEAQACRER